MSMTIDIVKTGTTETVNRIPNVFCKKDGTLWVGKTPVLNACGTLGKDDLVQLVKIRQYSRIPADNWFRMGKNTGGREVLTQEQRNARYLNQMSAEEKEKLEEAKVNAAKSRAWNDGINEGGEGYNPYA